MPRVKTLTICGEEWTIRTVRKCKSVRGTDKEDTLGDCDYKNKVIQIRSHQSPSDLVDTVLHEVIHARVPDLLEQTVKELANVQRDALALLGLI